MSLANANKLMPRRSALALMGAGALAPFSGCSGSKSPPSSPEVSIGEALHYEGLQEVARLIASRQVSPVELTQRILDRITKVDTKLKSYATMMAEQALTTARAAEKEIRAGKYRGPLHGMPIAVKDLCYSRGIRTMGGTPVLKGFVPDYDATVISKLYEAGAVVLGKLNLAEGGVAGYHPDFEIPVNPWDARRWTGVSSSGPGVALAAGLCFAAIGTDTGGSIRYPSSANGVVGLKPTFGRVSRFGVLPLAESLDHVGPMARRVADVAILFDVIAGYDTKDPTSLREPVGNTFGGLGQGIKGLRIGFDREYALAGVDRGQAASIEEALKVLASLGASIVEIRMPDMVGFADAWFLLCSSEAVASHSANYPSRAKEYGPYFREFLQSGAAASKSKLAGAKKIRSEVTACLKEVLGTVDALACPTSGAPAWPISKATTVGSMTAFHAAAMIIAATSDPPRKSTLIFTLPMNLAGVPAICLPSGFSPEGLPYSIQFVGSNLSEPVLCRIAHAYEQATTWHTRHPSVDTL